MLKNRKQHKIQKNLKQKYLKSLIIALVLGLTCTLFASCGKGANSYMNGSGSYSSETGPYSYETECFFLENDRGSYIYGELVIPNLADDSVDAGSAAQDADSGDAGSVTQATDSGECPLVFIAHGFKGTRNSGGAKQLSEKLAASGIAAVRIDFNGYEEESLKSERTNRYTLSDMQSDAVKTINYVMDNYSVDGNRLGVYGRSMGGRVAMMLANENVGDFDFKAMTLIAPAGDAEAMVYYMGGQEKWDDMKLTALQDGYCPKQTLELTYDWFTDFEDYDPSKTGYKFGEKPVLLYYNTLDTVVRPVTSLACAAAYENIETIEVTTEDGHGYEMGYEESELKDQIMTKIVAFFGENL